MQEESIFDFVKDRASIYFAQKIEEDFEKTKPTQLLKRTQGTAKYIPKRRRKKK